MTPALSSLLGDDAASVELAVEEGGSDVLYLYILVSNYVGIYANM